MDLANGIRILDERIDFWIEYVLNQEDIIEEESLFEFTYNIIDEWIADMDIGIYIHNELRTKLCAKGIKVLK